MIVYTVSASPGISLYNQGRLHAAREALEEAVDSGRAGTAEMAVLGMTYTRLGEYEKARRILILAQSQNPDNPDVLNALGMLEFATGDYESAYTWLKKAESRAGSSGQSQQMMVASLINRSIEQYEEGLFDEAETTLDRAHFLEPGNAVVLALLIQLRKEQGREDGLAELYRSFIAAEPDNAQAHAELGMLLDKQGLQPAAKEAFLKAEALSTEEPYPYLYLARCGSSQDRISRLHLAIGKAVRKLSTIRIQAAGAIQTQEGSLSSEDLKSLQELSDLSEKPQHILIEAIHLLSSSYPDRDEYEKDLLRLNEWYPHSYELRCALGALLEEQQRFSEALRHWRGVLEDYSTAPAGHIGHARCLEALGKKESAIIAYRRARDVAPENARIYEGLQRLYGIDGREPELLQLYEELYERERTNTVLIRAWADLEEKLGLIEEATTHRLRAGEIERRQ